MLGTVRTHLGCGQGEEMMKLESAASPSIWATGRCQM